MADPSAEARGGQEARVRFARSGGLAGVTLPLEPDELDPSEAREVDGLLQGIDLDALASRPQREGGPDRFTYELDVEHGGKRHRLTLAEEDVPEELKPLLRRLTKLAIEKRRAKGRGA